MQGILAIVGSHWAGVNEAGQPRLFEERDWVRIEIETALRRGIPVIPVLIDDAPLPRAEALPPSLRPFVERQVVRLNMDLDFDMQIKRLVRSIESHLGWSILIWRYAVVAACLAAALGLALIYLLHGPLSGDLGTEKARLAIEACNIEFAVGCAKEGGITGSTETLAGLRSCKNSEMFRSDDALLQWTDVWTTSVYSFAPGGGGPGGGLDDDVLKAGGWGDWYFSLIQFSLPLLKRRPDFAGMALYSKTDQLASVRIEVDQIIERWSFPKGDRLWWKNKPGARALTTEPLPAPGQDRWYLIELTRLAQQWFDGKSPNYGIQIRPASNFGSLVVFVSSDAPDKSKIPRLIFCS